MYDQKKADKIIEAIAAGKTLTSILRKKNMPTRMTIYRWEQDNPEFKQQLADARDYGADEIAQDCLEIADDTQDDYINELSEDGTFTSKLNREHVQRSKLRIETRLKLLACWNPRKYGQKLAVGGADDLPGIKTSIEVSFVSADK